jgi:thiamine biosynthesis lipoprotein
LRENKKTVITILLLSLAALILLILLLTDKPGERIQSRDYLDAFDTVSTLYDYSGDRDFESIADKVGEMMLEYHRLYDIYNSTPEKANIRTVNTAGGEAVVVDKRIIELIEWGIEIYYLTDGEVNIAMGSVTSLWKSSLKSGKIPTEKELSEAALHTDITKIEIDREKMTIRLSDPKMSLDVGAVAKGYTEEKIAEWLVSEGKSGYALDMG